MSANENPVPRANVENRADSKLLTGVPDSTKPTRYERPYRHFAEINRAALAAFPAVLNRLLPRGKAVGREIVALNPRRADRNLGSFKVNRFNGRWCDFATGDRGGDPISLVAYLADVSQGDAARLLAQMLGMETGGRHHG
jgi:hypothetical protein